MSILTNFSVLSNDFENFFSTFFRHRVFKELPCLGMNGILCIRTEMSNKNSNYFSICSDNKKRLCQHVEFQRLTEALFMRMSSGLSRCSTRSAATLGE
jgi:hypothetical protein